MKRLLIYLNCFLFAGGLESTLLSCSRWDLPALKEQSISKGLITYLPFTAKSLKDSIGNNNAVWGSAITDSSFTRDFKGQANSAIYLNGKNDYIKLLDNKTLQFDTAFSISLWIKPVIDTVKYYDDGKSNKVDRRMQIYNKSNYSNGANELYSSSMRGAPNVNGLPEIIVILADIKQESNCVSGRGWKSLAFYSTRTAFANNGWHHLVFSYSRSNAWYYLDGLLLDNRNPQNSGLLTKGQLDNCQGGADLRFGMQNSNIDNQGKSYENYFNGGMDEIRIYNRSLTATEVQTLYKLKDEL